MRSMCCSLRPRLHGNVFDQKRQFVFAFTPSVYTVTAKTLTKTVDFEDATKSDNLKNEKSINDKFPRVNAENDFEKCGF